MDSAPVRDEIDALLVQATGNWHSVRWRGHVLWQNPLDLNVLSEHLFAARPDVIVETGTYHGGSALFLADMMQLTGRAPDVISIDLAPEATPSHPGVRYLAGRSSTDAGLTRDVAALVGGRRAFVMLDSDHAAEHVFRELVAYAPLVRAGDYLLVQDGNMLSTLGMPEAATPIGGIVRFLAEHQEFAIDTGKSPFPTTAHVSGWLRRSA